MSETSSTIRILIAEDDEEDRFLMQDTFESCGISDLISFVDDGEKVFRELEAGLPSLIVLDLNMPRMNGTQALIKLKESSAYRHIPVIIFSTSLNQMEKDICMKEGALRYLIKPNSYDEYVNIAKVIFEIAGGATNKQ